MKSSLPAWATLAVVAAACTTAFDQAPEGEGPGATAAGRQADAAAPPGEPVAVAFAAMVGEEAFACGRSYPRVGSSHSTYEPVDLRLYVHDLRLLDANGIESPIRLADAAPWQDGEVALVDFTDGGGLCAPRAEAPRTVVTGRTIAAPAHGGLRMRVGVPAPRNILDPNDMPPPLHLGDLWEGPARGRRFLSVEGRVDGALDHVVHLASSGCTPVVGSLSCARPNCVDVELLPFDPDADTVIVDVGALLHDSHLTRPGGWPTPAGGAAGGCRAEEDNPACAPIFARLGLPFASGSATGPQRFIRRR